MFQNHYTTKIRNFNINLRSSASVRLILSCSHFYINQPPAGSRFVIIE